MQSSLFSRNGEHVRIVERVRALEKAHESSNFFLSFVLAAERLFKPWARDLQLQFPLFENRTVDLPRDQVITFDLYPNVLQSRIAGQPEQLAADEGIETGFRQAAHYALDRLWH